MERQADRQTNGQKDRQIDSQTGTYTTVRQSDRLRGRMTVAGQLKSPLLFDSSSNHSSDPVTKGIIQLNIKFVSQIAFYLSGLVQNDCMCMWLCALPSELV